MSLKTRFFLLAAVLFVMVSVFAWSLFRPVVERIVEEWGLRIAEIQVRYDSARMLQPLERELVLARQMADSNVLKRWAREPENLQLEQQALEEMESFRRNFRDRSFFVALLDSGAYYHNNANGDFTGQELRYHLQPDKPADAWFYRLVEEGRDFHINVNPDEHLGVTKLWVDVLMRDGDRILGVVGTGIPLDDFLQNIVDADQPGITTLFVDQSAAIQLHRDTRLIDYATIVKPEGQKKTIDLLFDNPADSERLLAMMSRLRGSQSPSMKVVTDFVTVDGKRHLAGIAYLPAIDWYEITLLDLDVLMPASSFQSVLLIFILIFLVFLLLMHLMLRLLILDPVTKLEYAMVQIRDGNLDPQALPTGKGEIARLIGHFNNMAEAIRSHTRDLEAKVQERTEALHTLARLDPLTNLVNRRGMTELLATEVERIRRQGSAFGVISLDVDNFKQLNDSRGHNVGDLALSQIADALRASIRPYDHPSRWGGDEFLVVLSPCDGPTLEAIGARIRSRVEKDLSRSGLALTVSVGGYLAQPADTVELILQRADEALYTAKTEGRNGLRIASPAPWPDAGVDNAGESP